MPKPKKSERELAKKLHNLGLRKSHAESIAKSTGRMEGKLPAGTRSSIKDLVSAVGDIGERLGGGSRDRTKAAEKGARTRKRNAEKRSQAARKAAKTRAKSA